MKKQVLCTCGSKKKKDDCCPTHTRVWTQPFTNQNERKKFLTKVKIGSQFGLRYRGLMEFYGEDLIAYKLESPQNRFRNEFLFIFSKYLTEYLEDDCPSSWKDCNPIFWEEFLITHYPFHIRISPDEKEVSKFITEYKRFIRWLDRRTGTSWQEIVESHIEEHSIELKKAEHILNRLYLHTFPMIHHLECDPQMDILENLHHLKNYEEVKMSIFEVCSLNDQVLLITDLSSADTYHVCGLPQGLLSSGSLLSGTIGKRKHDLLWTWHHPESVFPQGAKTYLEKVSLFD